MLSRESRTQVGPRAENHIERGEGIREIVRVSTRINPHTVPDGLVERALQGAAGIFCHRVQQRRAKEAVQVGAQLRFTLRLAWHCGSQTPRSHAACRVPRGGCGAD